MTSAKKSLIFAGVLSTITMITAYTVQSTANSDIPKCSYLDPIAVDILAFLAAVFLVVEGVYSIILHTEEPFKNQFSRSLRIAFGCAILTLHTMQFLHK